MLSRSRWCRFLYIIIILSLGLELTYRFFGFSNMIILINCQLRFLYLLLPKFSHVNVRFIGPSIVFFVQCLRHVQSFCLFSFTCSVFSEIGTRNKDTNMKTTVAVN